jgi:arabinose-5-phosphate isomerase
MNPSSLHTESARRVLLTEAQGVMRLSERIDSSFSAAITLLADAQRVFVVGIGKSALIGAKIAATFASIGKPAHVLHPVEALHGDIGNVTAGSCVIMISKSGTTSELHELLPFLRDRKVPVIGLFGTPNTTLAKRLDVVLDCSVDREACSLNVAPTASTTAALAMGDALAVVLMEEMGGTTEQFAFHHPAGQLGHNVTRTVAEVMHYGDQLPIVPPDALLRDALIVGSEKGMGCVCVLNAEQQLLGLVTDGDIRRLLQLRDDVLTLSVHEVMTQQPVFARPEQTLQEALHLMENRASQISVLPVVSTAGVCVGVIRIHDILRY